MCYVMLALSPIYLSKSIYFSLFLNFIFHFLHLHCHNLSPSHHHLLSGFPTRSPPPIFIPSSFPNPPTTLSSQYFKTANVIMLLSVYHLSMVPHYTENKIQLLQVGYKSLPTWPLAAPPKARGAASSPTLYARPHRSPFIWVCGRHQTYSCLNTPSHAVSTACRGFSRLPHGLFTSSPRSSLIGWS